MGGQHNGVLRGQQSWIAWEGMHACTLRSSHSRLPQGPYWQEGPHTSMAPTDLSRLAGSRGGISHPLPWRQHKPTYIAPCTTHSAALPGTDLGGFAGGGGGISHLVLGGSGVLLDSGAHIVGGGANLVGGLLLGRAAIVGSGR